MYSITNEIDAATVAGEIAAHKATGNKTILVVEGPTDEKFFSSYRDDANCVIVIAHGWENALGGLQIARGSHLKGIVVVIDQDYKALLGTCPQDEDVVVTEHHDIETMLFRSPALDKIIKEHAQPNKIETFVSQGGDMRRSILAAAAPLGALRYYSLANGLALDFDGYEHGHVSRNLCTSHDELVRKVFARSKKKEAEHLALKPFIVNAVQTIDHHILCCGHDIAAMIGKALQSLLGNQNAQIACTENIERLLRIAFGADDFRATRLYRDIKAWEARNPPFVVLGL